MDQATATITSIVGCALEGCNTMVEATNRRPVKVFCSDRCRGRHHAVARREFIERRERARKRRSAPTQTRAPRTQVNAEATTLLLGAMEMYGLKTPSEVVIAALTSRLSPIARRDTATGGRDGA